MPVKRLMSNEQTHENIRTTESSENEGRLKSSIKVKKRKIINNYITKVKDK